MFEDNPFEIIPNYEDCDKELSAIAPSGYCLVLHAHVWKTKFVYSTYPEAWRDHYDTHNLVVLDPVVLWGMVNTGTTRWSGLDNVQRVTADYVMTRAKDFGLAYGAVAVTRSKHLRNKKCLLAVSRPDRELTSEEIARVAEILDHIVTVHDGRLGLSDVDIQTIQTLALGYSQDEIAKQMHTSRDTVKKRIERIRKKIGARNATHVVSIALSHSLV
ncbi:autoinducer binding domain-containing protein [Psychromarinibacter sp. S121]|uniref:helix-turn-helix transcriptional regulator n=1 Tax=Psychromarinibacter sp. S121 TaxID=3415127 RepID=UPI003C7A4D33